MPGSMSIYGVASGIKTDEIVTEMMAIARRPQNMMLADKALAQRRLTAWQALNTRILALKLKTDSVAVAGAFRTCTATSSDTDIVVATPTASATPGMYYLKVSNRAQAHQLSSQTYTSMDDDIGTGTVSISFTQDASKDFEVTVDSANNTLAGLRDTINGAEEGVEATIINSGTSASPEYRLILTSTETGDASVFTVDTSGMSGGTTPTVTQIVQQADDAEITFGDGAGAITVTKSTNTVTDLIPGVTLNIGIPDAAETVKIEVTRNVSGMKSSIEALISEFNDVMDAIDVELDYDAETRESGLLLGSYDLQSVQTNIISAMTSPVDGVVAQFSALATIGITLSTAGHLVIDDSTLTAALNDNLEDVAKLFAADMESDSTYITYIASSTNTQPSGDAGWEVDITQAARRTQVTAAVSMANPLDADERLWIDTNDSVAQYVYLTAGMTLTDVAAEINKYSSETGVTALATGAGGTGSGNYLTLRTVRYGDATELSAYSALSNGGANTSGLGNVTVSGADPGGETGTGTGLTGLDVEGTIDGEIATGNGQILTADPADEDSDISGLVLYITSTATLTSDVYFTKGVGATLRDLLIGTTSSTGIVTSAQDSLDTEIEDLDDSISEMEERLTLQANRLYQQFAAMEGQLSRLQQQGNYLASQFSAMNKG